MHREGAWVRVTGRTSMWVREQRGVLCVCMALAGAASVVHAARATPLDNRADTASARARAATFYIGSVPPSAADRRGLLRAFHHVHGARSHVLLAGFRECCIFSNTPGQVLHSAAAYFLTAGTNGSYGSAVIELYRRAHGDTWVHVARFKNTTPTGMTSTTSAPGSCGV